MNNRYLFLLSTCFGFFSSIVSAQQSWDEPYFFTRIGSYTFNELNIGYGIPTEGGITWELMAGLDYGSGFWENKCGSLGLWGTEQFRARTALRGINFRPTVYFNEGRSLGLSGIFRFAKAKDFWASDNCNNLFDMNTFYSEYQAFDYGCMFNFHFFNRKRISLLIAPGYKYRSYDKTRTEVNSQQGQNLSMIQESSKRGFTILDVALQIKFGRKKE